MISFFAIPSILKDKVKQDFPEATLFVAEDMDASQHGKKPRKKREKKEPESDLLTTKASAN